MRRHLMLVLIFAVSLFACVSSAQAVVVEDEGSHFGVALVPGTRESLKTAGIPAVTSSPPCTDPAITPDLIPSEFGLCWHGGAVMHANETFALTWDPIRSYFATTKEYVEQFLRDVADGSGTLSSPYAVTSQYTDSSGGRAGNVSRYGGACTDFGSVQEGWACDFAGPGAGHNYPANGCTPSGTTDTVYVTGKNGICLTDAQIKAELTTMVEQTGVLGRTEPGYTPTLVLLMPPDVEICLDRTEVGSGKYGKLCSAATESTAPAQFCSYHSQVDVGGSLVSYVVQPWTALAQEKGVPKCDEPGLPTISESTDAHTLAVDLGTRLVSPLSQAHIAAIVNPGLINGWFALNGSEINDNGCKPLGPLYDGVTVGSGSYQLQREFNNAGLMEIDPNAQPCTPNVVLEPTFVVPSAVNQGDVVQFDGSTSPSTLIVPASGYAWSFGDGTSATGPSVEHAYAKGGTYSVTLTLTDRGGNVRSLTQTISVLGPNGQVVTPPPAAGGSNGSNGTSPGLHVKLQLLPEGLKALLRRGIALKVTANEAADGIASVSIAHREAKRAHVAVVIGRGTVKGLIDGTVELHLRLPKKVAAKIRHLRRVTLTIRLMLIDHSGDRQTVVVAGRY